MAGVMLLRQGKRDAGQGAAEGSNEPRGAMRPAVKMRLRRIVPVFTGTMCVSEKNRHSSLDLPVRLPASTDPACQRRLPNPAPYLNNRPGRSGDTKRTAMEQPSPERRGPPQIAGLMQYPGTPCRPTR